MSESIGAKLKQARESRRLTLQQVSETTKVRTHYLQALENDDLSAISSVAQARGFLRIYAEFLGLTPADLVPVVIPADIVSTSKLSDNLTTSLKEEAIHDKSVKTGILTNFFKLFRRPAVDESTSSMTAKNTSSNENLKPTDKESILQVQATEKQPEITVPVSVTKQPEVKKQILDEVGSPSPKTPKKTTSKQRKSSANIESKDDVKKKADG
jgi:cytoskeletal protein RodZ